MLGQVQAWSAINTGTGNLIGLAEQATALADAFSGKRVASEFTSAIWALTAPVIILGGILGGVFTPTEAAAVAVIYSFFVGKFIFREIAWKDLPGILFQSGITTGAILLIISLANVFAWVIAAN